LWRRVAEKEAGKKKEKRRDEDLDADFVEAIPTTTVFEPAVIGVLRIHLCDAVVDGHQYGDGKDDSRGPENSGREERSESKGIGPVLEGIAEDERECSGVPEGHPSPKGASDWGSGLRMGLVGESAKLRVDEGRYCEFVADHGGCDGCGGDVVSDGHGDWMHEICQSIVKWRF
jgi:hypothetical protein